MAELSEWVRRVCNNCNIRTAFKSADTLRSTLVEVKDSIPKEKESEVVYEVPCSCEKVYIGETKRTPEIRMKEHRAAALLRTAKEVNNHRACLAGWTYNRLE